jgi:hypothetical protein
MRANPLRLKFLVCYTKDTIYPKRTKVFYDKNDSYLSFIIKIQDISGHGLCHYNYFCKKPYTA